MLGAVCLAALVSWGAQPLDPDPPREPEPPDESGPGPEPEPAPEEPEPSESDAEQPTGAGSVRDRRVGGAPNIDVDVSDRLASIDLGGDLIIKPRCNDEGKCNGGRIGFVGSFPIAARSPTGGNRATVDALDGFRSSWRIGFLGEYLRDATQIDGPAKMYLLAAGVDWGLQTFKYFPDGREGARTRNKHSASVLLRFLAYIHEPRRRRIAPQLLIRYDRNWVGARSVGVILPGEDMTQPIFVEDKVVTGPQTRPTFTASVPVLFTVQRGKWVLPQLGFGPTLRVATAGETESYNPFGDAITVRPELWLYWYPTGKEGLELQKTNVRIGAAPYIDIFAAGRDPDQPPTNIGGLLEVKVGVRGYEY